MKVSVVWGGREVQDLVAIELPPGATVSDALVRSGLLARYRLDAAEIVCAIFGRRASAHTLLAEGDRVELTRPLCANPKDLRRRRARNGRAAARHAEVKDAPEKR